MRFRMKKSFEALGLRWSRTRERGATAVVIALTLVLVMGAAALSFDTANLAWQRQTLRNITDAAAQAGATYLPDATKAVSAAKDYFHMSDTSYTPNVTAWCMVPSTGATKQPNPLFIPATCNPGGSGTYMNGVGGVVCDTVLCAIPCPLTAPKCNAIKVDAQKNVPFYFAPAIGIDSGSTGAVSSVSCAAPCGTLMPNAMDIAMVVDRTTSLNSTVFASMQQGIKDALSSMTPEYQFVTLGAIHKSTPKTGCDTNLPEYTGTKPPDGMARLGSWMPMGFSNDYRTGTLTSTSRALNTSSTLVKDVTCMNQASQPWGTHLAAPLKSAARKLLGYDSSNLSTLSAARLPLLPQGATVKKAIIMETDGVPEETIGYNYTAPKNSSNTSYKDTDPRGLGSTNLTPTDTTDPVSGNPSTGGELGCSNLKTVADQAKTLGITVIMIGYGQATTGAHCNAGSSSGTKVADVLAASSSNAPNGSPSVADTNCSTVAGAAAENSDGDFYFCAATGAQLAGIFSTAVSQIASGTKFVKMPGS